MNKFSDTLGRHYYVASIMHSEKDDGWPPNSDDLFANSSSTRCSYIAWVLHRGERVLSISSIQKPGGYSIEATYEKIEDNYEFANKINQEVCFYYRKLISRTKACPGAYYGEFDQ